MDTTNEPMPPYQPVQTMGKHRGEPLELSLARQTRNATVFIAWVVGIFAVMAIIGGIIYGVQLAKLNSNLTGSSGTTSSDCQSQGGTIAGC
jgi:hypothetical protein